MCMGFWDMTPPIYKQALDVRGSVLLSASGGKCGRFMTAWGRLYGGIVVVCLNCNMSFAELCVCMVVVYGSGPFCLSILKEDVSDRCLL